MANEIRFKRGSSLSNAGTPAEGEPLYNTTTGELFIGDGDTLAESLTAIGGSGNTWRPVIAGGNSLSDSETLTFTAGDNITISEADGAVTIASSASTDAPFAITPTIVSSNYSLPSGYDASKAGVANINLGVTVDIGADSTLTIT